MKQFLSIFLTVCLILAAFAGCEAPVNDGQTPGTTLPSGSSEPTDSSNTGSTGSTGATQGNGTAESTEPSEGNGAAENTEPTEGSGATENSQPTEGNSSSDSKLKGEPITEAQFNALTTNAPTNYTYTETRTYNGTTTCITMLVNGKEYLQTQVEDNTTRKILGILRDSSVYNYMYNESTGKWETSNTGVSSSFPLEGFPMALSNFTYDEALGAYRLIMSEGDMTAEIQLMFKDGQLIYIGQFDGTNEDHTVFSDYGTTVIPMPGESDIVDTNNGSQTGTSSNP